MHRLFNANACGRRHMMQGKPWHWRVRHHHGQGGGRAQWRERQGDVATTQIQAAVVKIAAPAGFSAHPAGGWFPYLAKNGGAAARTACVGSTVQGAAARGSRPFCKKAWRKARKSARRGEMCVVHAGVPRTVHAGGGANRLCRFPVFPRDLPGRRGTTKITACPSRVRRPARSGAGRGMRRARRKRSDGV